MSVIQMSVVLMSVVQMSVIQMSVVQMSVIKMAFELKTYNPHKRYQLCQLGMSNMKRLRC
jgi:hypothetical protein